MDCRDVEKLIDAYWDGDLSPDASGRMRAHMERCPACRPGYGRLDDWLNRSAPISAPSGLRDRVLEAVLTATARSASAVVEGPAASAGSPLRLVTSQPASNAPPARPNPGVYRFVSLGWVGALAACIVLVLASRSQIPTGLNGGMVGGHKAGQAELLSNASAVPSLLFAAIQPSQLSMVGAVAAQAAALEQANESRAELPLPLRMGRRPLREDYVPLSSPRAIQQLPAVITVLQPLGA